MSSATHEKLKSTLRLLNEIATISASPYAKIVTGLAVSIVVVSCLITLTDVRPEELHQMLSEEVSAECCKQPLLIPGVEQEL